MFGQGPQISAKLKELGIDSEFRGGFRVTTDETIGVVRDVLRDQISESLAAQIRHAGAGARVMSGEDGNLFRAVKTTIEQDGETIDIGLVGEVNLVNPRIVFDALEQGDIPVISTVAPDAQGNLLNVNADLAAAALAARKPSDFGNKTYLASSMSWRTMMASRAGPTPIAEMRHPLNFSRATT